MEVRILKFSDLTPAEVYEVLRLRAEIFVVEQDCAYLDPDGKDPRAIHVLGWEGDRLAAYTRIFAPGDYMEHCSIGRVAVRAEFRGQGLGYRIMKASLRTATEHYGSVPIVLSAQRYLREFYENLGFKTEGAEYLEDGIPHIRMVRKAS